MQRLLAVTMCALIAVSATSANATPAQQQAVLKIDISAEVVGRCGVAATSPRTSELVRLDQPTTVTFDFELDCNTPFRIGLAARSGGMKLDDAAPGGADLHGFAATKPYDVSLRFGTDQAGQVDAGSCAASSLVPANGTCNFYGAVAGSGFSPGRFVTAVQQGGTLQVSWKGEDADPVRLAAGNYSDVITVVVGPRT